MKKISHLLLLPLLFGGCASTFTEPTIDFSEDEVLLEKIRERNSGGVRSTNEDNSLYDEKSVDLLSDFKVDLKVGDVISVIITENVSRNSIANKQTTTESSMQMNPMTVNQPQANHPITSKIVGKLQPIFNLGVESDKSSSFKGSVNAINQESFETSVNAIITRQVSGDLFFIEAKKTILLSNEKQKVRLTGYVHKNDIGNDYEITSSKVVDLKVSYENEGSGEDATNSSGIKRIFDKIFF